MSAKNMIRLEGPIGADLGQGMSEIRARLDSQKIQPSSFKSVSADSSIEFQIVFRGPEDADRFREQFMPR
jgi:hypothetical protein